jgi:hypothetical protein
MLRWQRSPLLAAFLVAAASASDLQPPVISLNLEAGSDQAIVVHSTFYALGEQPYLAPNQQDGGGSNVKSLAQCEAQCLGLYGCKFGTFVNTTADLGECWLASFTPGSDRPCGTACVSFKLEEPQITTAMAQTMASPTHPLGSGALCHHQQEWETMLYGGEPGWVETQCKAAVGQATKIYARRCKVLEDDDQTCPEPTPAAYDHHTGTLDDRIITTRKLYVMAEPKHSVTKADQTVAAISYSMRGEYLINYDVDDDAGNSADTMQFAMIMADHENPELEPLTPPPPTLESLNEFTQFFAIPERMSLVMDAYDGDVSETLSISSVRPDGTVSEDPAIDTSILGNHTVIYAARDYASIFGVANHNNVAMKTYTVEVVDSEPPTVLCKTADTVTCSITGSCSGVGPCEEVSIECGSKFNDRGAVCLDMRDSFDVTSQALDPDMLVPAVQGSIDTSVPGIQHLVYTCTDGANNANTVTQSVNIGLFAPPEVTLTDTTDLNLMLQLSCGAFRNEENIVLATGPQSFSAFDSCGVNAGTTCKVELYADNCAGDFSCIGPEGSWETCHGGTHSPIFTVEDSTPAEMAAPFMSGAGVGTYGLKYSCSNRADLSTAKCRTIINSPSNTCGNDCIMSGWEAWDCATCGITPVSGTERSRSVLQQGSEGGTSCGVTRETHACDAEVCPHVNCIASEWNVTSGCNATCGSGLITNERTIVHTAIGTGDCPQAASLREYDVCYGAQVRA